MPGPLSAWLPVRWRLDRAAALVLLVPATPLLVVLAVVVRLSSPGPALIRLPRVGRDGRAFRMWKLRSMHHGPRQPRAAYAPLTTTHDDRITRFGRILRRCHLDELPQLLNVVQGDMGLIGPRPETPEYVDMADPRWAGVLTAKPGILGPTQLLAYRWEAQLLTVDADNRYRSIVLPAKLAVDAWYLANASPRLDALSFVCLLQELAVGPKTTRLHARVIREVADAGVVLPSGSP